MALLDTYFASDNTLPGRNGSINNPYRDPSELPVPWTMAGGNAYWFHGDAPDWNFAASLRNLSFTVNPITIGGYGSNSRKPRIGGYRFIDGSECVEVSIINTSGVLTTTPQAGTKLWRVPAEFLGLFQGNKWGPACDVTGTAGSSGIPKTPSKAYEWTYQSTDAGLYRVVWSEGNPVLYYGALFATSFSHSDAGSSTLNNIIIALQAYGGCWIDGIVFDTVYRPTFLTASSPPIKYARMRSNNLSNCELYNSRYGFSWAGGDSADPPNLYKGHEGVRVYGNYGENLAQSFIDFAYASSPGSITLNDTRIYDNVGNGFGIAVSTAGIYVSNCQTSDGSYIIVERNSLSGGIYGNVWVSDGHGFYSENRSRSQIWRYNFGWNNDLNMVFNGTSGSVMAHNNVFYAKENMPNPGIDRAIVISGGATGVLDQMDLLLQNNVAINFRRFALCTTNSAAAWKARLLGNVSRTTKTQTGPSYVDNVNFLSLAFSSALSHFTLDGNSIYGHSNDIWDGSAHSGLNTITTDPADELARIPVPTDPRVNYAKQISPNLWKDDVNLGYGTRLAA